MVEVTERLAQSRVARGLLAARSGLHSVGSCCEGENPSGVTLGRCAELCSRALRESQEKIVEAQGSVKPLRSCGFLTPHQLLPTIESRKFPWLEVEARQLLVLAPKSAHF